MRSFGEVPWEVLRCCLREKVVGSLVWQSLTRRNAGEDEVPDEPMRQPSDLWLLGDRWLLCGDAGKTFFDYYRTTRHVAALWGREGG